MIYTAQWESVYYTVDYKFVSKSIPENVVTPLRETLSYGAIAKQPTPYTVTGWTFEGWFIDEKCTELFDFNSLITKDITLYGRWTEVENPNQIQPSDPDDMNTRTPSIDTSDTNDWNVYFAMIIISLVILYVVLKKRLKYRGNR